MINYDESNRNDIFFSVVIPMYNREKTINRAIDSVLTQTFTRFEIIIVDDCSTDNSVDLVKKYDDKRIHLYSLKKNSGANVARNKGIKKAIGKWIAFLDSDDEWSFDHLSVIYNLIMEDSNLKLISTGANIIYGECKNISLYPRTNGGDIYFDEIIFDLLNATSCNAVCKETIMSCGGFDIRLPARQDYDMWLRISKNNKVGVVNKCVTKIYWDNHTHIGGDYRKYVKGTKYVIRKILNDNDISKKIAKKVLYSHYIDLAKLCARANSFNEARHYLYKAITANKKISIYDMCLANLMLFPKLYSFLLKKR